MSIPQPQDRIERGITIYAAGNARRIAPDQWAVISATDNKTTYNVTPQGCNCPDAKKGLGICKHGWATIGYIVAVVIVSLRKAESISQANRILEPVCSSIINLPLGYRRTLDLEYQQAAKRISAKTGDKSEPQASTTQPKPSTPAAADILIKKECTHADCKTTRCNYDQRIGGIAV